MADAGSAGRDFPSRNLLNLVSACRFLPFHHHYAHDHASPPHIMQACVRATQHVSKGSLAAPAGSWCMSTPLQTNENLLRASAGVGRRSRPHLDHHSSQPPAEAAPSAALSTASNKQKQASHSGEDHGLLSSFTLEGRAVARRSWRCCGRRSGSGGGLGRSNRRASRATWPGWSVPHRLHQAAP